MRTLTKNAPSTEIRKESHPVRARSGTRRILAALLVVIFALLAVPALSTPASASGCSWPPCGALNNKDNYYSVQIRWKNNDSDPWTYEWVAPGTTRGGYFNDGIDVDYYWVASHQCMDTPSGIKYGGTSGQWIKIVSAGTVTVYDIWYSYYC